MSKSGSGDLRAAKPEDAETVRALVRSAYAKWVPVIGREPLPMVADYDRAIRDHDITLVHIDGERVGLIELIRQPDHLFIENIAVAPAHQGRGIGRRLLAHAEREADLRGFSEIRLLTNAAFESNIRLYLGVGYRIDREEPFKGGLTVHMVKSLISP